MLLPKKKVIIPGKKKCCRCKKYKPVEDFTKSASSDDGLDKRCRKCACTYQKKLRKSLSPEEAEAKRRRMRVYAWLKAGIILTVEEFEYLEQTQNKVCAICGKPDKTGRRLSVDHCHTTGVVRGLLCFVCNAGIGHFRDDPDLLLKAIAYLGRTKKA